MSRLIDADAFIEYVNRRYDLCSDELRMMIEEQPTAYDVEKVVAELEERRSEYEIHSQNAPDEISSVYRKGVMRGYEYSQGIVRKGGVE